MPSHVRFSEDTKVADSPHKGFINKSNETNATEDLAHDRGELRFNMHGKITLVSSDDFFAHFLPSVNTPKSAINAVRFAELAKPSSEGEMYSSLVSRSVSVLTHWRAGSLMWWLQPSKINDAKICPGFTVVAHPYRADKTEHTKQAVDMGMYPDGAVPEPSKNGTYPAMDWFNVELPMECKADSTEQDPFDEHSVDGEPLAEKRKDALGQILSYAELVFKRQQRMFFFMLIFLGDFVRIARFDHSGVFATHKMNYKTDGEAVVKFLSAYSRLSAAKRGHDPTAKRIRKNSKLYNAMCKRGRTVNPDDSRDYVRVLFEKSLDTDWPWWQLEVPMGPAQENDKAVEQKPTSQRFVVGKPHFQAPGVAGRFTRGYVALPVTEKGEIPGDAQFVFLKDAWRVDHDGIEQEGVTLRFLNDHNVKCVPTLVCHGDLGQVTKSQDHWHAFHPGADRLPLKRHSHYRLVMKEVGLPLEEFQGSSLELCYVVYCCLRGKCC